MDTTAWVRLGIEAAAAIVAPPACAACDEPLGMGGLRAIFCATCAGTIVRVEARGEDHAAAFAYGGAIARAVARMKYEDRPDLARRLAELAMHALVAVRTPVDVVVPVPLHPARLASRKYNQAALLAAPLAKRLGAKLEARALARSRDTKAQAELDREARLANLTSAFVARRRMPGARVLLVDDVRTTGATLRACAAALREADVTDVQSLVVARTE